MAEAEMAVSVEAEREAQKALLRMETEIGNHKEQFEILHRLVELELGAGELEQARSWLMQAGQVLDRGHLELRFRERHRRLEQRVERAVRSGAPSASRGDEPVTQGEREESTNGQNQVLIAASEGEGEARRADTLCIGVSLDRIPERFGYIRDGGPSIPKRVHYVATIFDEHSAWVGSWIAMSFYAALVLMFAIMAFANISTGKGLYAAISAGLVLLFGALCGTTAYRIRVARADARASAAGTYRLGWYFDDDAMVLRAPNGFSIFPRSRVTGARVDSRYDSNIKRTLRSLVISYSDASGQPVELIVDNGYGSSPGKLADLINRWKEHGRV
jgi:hypothetical protein